MTSFAFGDLLAYFVWLGTFGFGGSIALAGYLQRDLVEEIFVAGDGVLLVRGWRG